MKNARTRRITEILMSAVLILSCTLCGLLTIVFIPEAEAVAAPARLDHISVEMNLHTDVIEKQKESESGATTLAFTGNSESVRAINLVNVIENDSEDIEEEFDDVANSHSPSMSAMNLEKEEIVEETIPVEEKPIDHNDYYFGLIPYTEEDVFYVAAGTYAEGRGEPYKGKVAIAATMVNRRMHEDFPDTFYEVITQEGQFASISWVTKEMIDQVPECWEAAIEALNGADPTFEITGEHALYFYNPAGCSQYQLNVRANIKNPCTIGAHVFYRYW